MSNAARRYGSHHRLKRMTRQERLVRLMRRTGRIARRTGWAAQ